MSAPLAEATMIRDHIEDVAADMRSLCLHRWAADLDVAARTIDLLANHITSVEKILEQLLADAK